MADYNPNPNLNFMPNMTNLPPIPPPPPAMPHPAPHPTYTHMHPTDLAPLDPISRQTAEITSLRLQLHHSNQQAAESVQALHFLLKITSQQAAQQAHQPLPSANDLELEELRKKYKQLELECQSLRDQICYLIQRAGEQRRRRRGRDEDDDESVAYPASSDEEEREDRGGRSRGRRHNQGHGQLGNVTAGVNGGLAGKYFDNGFVQQRLPEMVPGYQNAQTQFQTQARRAAQVGYTASAAQAGPQRPMLQPSPMGKDGRDMTTVPAAASVLAPKAVHVEQPALIDFDHHEPYVEGAPVGQNVRPAPATPKTPIHREPEVQKLDAKAVAFVPETEPAVVNSAQDAQVVSLDPADESADVSSHREPKAEIGNSKQSVALNSMEEGTREWDDEDERPQLPPLPVLDLDNPPTTRGKFSREVGLEHSRHNPSAHQRYNCNPVDNFTSRPAHARDEDWIIWKPISQKWQTSHRVIVTNLPDNITPHTLLSQVCGGLVISCQLLDTTALTGTQSALIRFHDTDESCAFVKYAKLHPIIFTDSLNTPMTARVALIKSPSFPLTARRLDGVRRLGHTRCLMIRNFPLRVDTEEAVRDLRWFLRPYAQCKHDFVETIESRGEGVVYLAFVSIEAAVEAFGRFMANPLYRGVLARFVEDPCNRPAKVLVAREDEREREKGQQEDAEKVKDGQTELHEGKPVTQSETADKLNPDEIDIGLGVEEDKDRDLDDESVALSIKDGLMTPPDSSSEVGDDENELAQRDMGRSGDRSLRKEFVPRRWDKARERELEMAALRGSPGSRE